MARRFAAGRATRLVPVRDRLRASMAAPTARPRVGRACRDHDRAPPPPRGCGARRRAWSTSRSTSTTGRGRSGSTRRCGRASTTSARYPNASEAEAALARRHGRDASEVLATAGAAEAFALIARARDWTRPVVVHPQFTEPDVALTLAGHPPEHVLLDAAAGFALDADTVPDDADLVIVGNPTNPTSVLHPESTLRALARPGRVLVVDEAFMDSVPGEHHSLAVSPHPRGRRRPQPDQAAGRSPASAPATSWPSPPSSPSSANSSRPGPSRPPPRPR